MIVTRHNSSIKKNKRQYDNNINLKSRMMKKQRNEEETQIEEDEEEEENENMSDNIENEDAHVNPASLLPFMFNDKNRVVFAKDNHIYYRGLINKHNIFELNDLIKKKNDEWKKSLLEIKKKCNICSKIESQIELKPIYLHITSQGGSVYTGMLAVDHIKNSKIPIHTIVEGISQSAGTFLSIAGKKRYITERSSMLIHQPNIQEYGTKTFANIKDGEKNMTKIFNDISKLYIEHTKLKKKQLDKILYHDLELSAEECIKYGLVDEIWRGDD
jgi:ATP-dependent Clp endopeptidase proteolytic subunit ClpP